MIMRRSNHVGISDKKPLYSLTRKDFRIDYYKGTGKGGQKKNKTENCCRITHIESGAVGKSEEGRSKLHNQKTAFQRMIQTEEFQKWHRIETAKRLGKAVDLEQEIEKALHSDNLRIECKDELGRWTEITM